MRSACRSRSTSTTRTDTRRPRTPTTDATSVVSVRRSSSITASFTSTTRSFVTSVSADDIEIDGTLIRELKGYEGESRKTMLTAIAKEIHGLCALGTFVVGSFCKRSDQNGVSFTRGGRHRPGCATGRFPCRDITNFAIVSYHTRQGRSPGTLHCNAAYDPHQ